MAGAGSDEDEESEGAPVDGLEEDSEGRGDLWRSDDGAAAKRALHTPGAYESVFFPMKPGDYTFRIYGKLGDTDIDESFTSSPEGFGAVEDPAPLQFPK